MNEEAKGEREKKSRFFYRQRGKHSEFREEDKIKGGVLALLALSGIKFTPYGEQCVREWRGQRKGRKRKRKTDRQTLKRIMEKKCSSKEI